MAAKKTTSRKTRPANLPHGRWLSDLGRLRKAERALVDACAKGEFWVPEGWDGKRPEPDGKTNANYIRASLIRFLMLDGDAKHPVHEKGIQIQGAWVEEKLDLKEIETPLRLAMLSCYFSKHLDLSDACVSGLFLNESHFPHLNGQRMRVTGNVFLSKARCEDEVILSGIRIGGQLSCVKANMRNCDQDGMPIGHALNAQGAKIEGDVSIDSANLEGAVRFSGAIIGGQLDCEDARLIGMQEARRKAKRLGNRQPRRFDGSHIQSIRMAIDWNWKWVSNRVERSWHWIYGILAGYGYRPQRIVYLMFGIAFLSGIAFHLGAQNGYFAPTDPVLSSPDLAPTLAEQCGHALDYVV